MNLRYPMIIVASLLCLLAHSQKLKITPLTNDTFIFTTYNDYNGTPFPSNGMYIVTDKGIVIIDTPWDETQFQPLLDSIQKRHHQKPVLCIATHFHDDRTAGLAYFRSKGINTYTSAQTKKLSIKNGEKQAEFTFAKDTTFTLGGKKIQTFYPGKGHTEDNIVIWLPNEKILYGGCFLKSTENQSLGNIADADLKAWPKSVKKTIRKFQNPKYVIPGHFGWEGDGLKHTLGLLKV